MAGDMTRAPARAVDRRRWAVEAMAVAPGDRVLEIGCGAGAATALIAERLRTGKVVAVDRSASAVRRARERNAAHIRAGTVDVRHADVTAADLPDGAFDKVFAVNVSLFWLATPPGLLDRLRRLLAPDGSLYVFAERPTRTAVEAIATTVADALRGHGFGTVTATVSDSRAAVAAS